MTKCHDTQIGEQVVLQNAGDLFSLATDEGYDWDGVT